MYVGEISSRVFLNHFLVYVHVKLGIQSLFLFIKYDHIDLDA